jgi:hypothetical protein
MEMVVMLHLMICHDQTSVFNKLDFPLRFIKECTIINAHIDVKSVKLSTFSLALSRSRYHQHTVHRDPIVGRGILKRLSYLI